MIVIDPVNSDWVRRIFHWYVVELRSIFWITKELNRLQAPRDHRASSNRGWSSTCVRHVLENFKYIGQWCYGKHLNVYNPLTGESRQTLREESDPGVSITERPELRVIDDATFYAAQKRLKVTKIKYSHMRSNGGRLKGSVKGQHNPKHLLQGLMHCSKCGRPMHMNGLRGFYLQCSGYPSRHCDVKTSLFRKYAEKSITNLLRTKLLEQQEYQESLLDAVMLAWQESEAKMPNEKLALEKRRQDVLRRIQNLADRMENGDKDVELSSRLGERRRELGEIDGQLALIKGKEKKFVGPPTPEWIRSQLEQLHQLLLIEPARSALVLRELIGTIVVKEVELSGLKAKGAL